MKSLTSPGRAFGGIEPLEARIAPAVILVGNPNSTQDVEYNEQNSPFRHLADGTDSISTSVRGDGTVAGNAYALYLSAGDVVKLYNSSNGFDEYITVKSGNVVAFFIDTGLVGEVQAGELASLSLGKNASVSVSSGLSGDVITNLDEKGTASTADDTISMTGLVSDQQGIKGLNIGGGNVVGKIMAGGNITKVSINGTAGAILAGAAVNRLNPAGESFDLLPGVDGGNGTVSFTVEDGVAGSSISKIFVDGVGSSAITGAEARIEAGAGGAGAKGGSVSNVRVGEDSTGFSILAGAGGAGLTSGKTSGGAGGVISKIYVSGIADVTPGELVVINSGAGGDAGTGTAGIGGKGGTVSQVYVGFQVINGKPFQTLDPLADQIHIASGAGGDGKNGGAGGVIKSVDVITTSPDVAGDEISIIAGAGGASTASGVGKAGKGGSLTGVSARELAIESDIVLESSVVLQAGAGGAGSATANGGVGGGISNATVIGAEFQFLAGNGGNGRVGGAGGGISNVKAPLAEGVLSHVGIIGAGFGGNGGDGNGGKGGSIKNVQNEFGDFSEYLINPGTSGNGGASTNAKGGAGGSISGLDLFDGLTGTVGKGNLTVRTGDGGDGSDGAGVGGSLKRAQVIATDMDVQVRSGSGGDIAAGANASGGNAGAISKVQIQAQVGIESTVALTVQSGVGGLGVGTRGSGGDGGDIKSLNARYAGTVLVQGGDGGSGGGGSAGDGGSIILSGAFGTAGISGNGTMLGGNAGAAGSAPGDGGSIRGASPVRLTGLYANDNLTIKAGDGTNGGAGGSIAFVGYGGTTSTLQPSPSGNILIQAGAGSTEGRFAGAGGSINSVSGSVASGDASLTSILGGDGAGVATALKSSAGGSISNLTVFLGGGDGSELRIKAGDAGDSTDVAKGANGGNLQNITVSGIDAATLVRSIAAGDGGDAAQQGGQGGSIGNVRVFDHEIGVLTGEEYGYEKMGGIFAGVGGNAATDGKSGSINGLSATAIAAIVAGRGATPELVERVQNVYIGTPQSTGKPLTDLLLVRDGDLDLTDGGDAAFGRYVLDSYLAGNFVGAVSDPTRVDANKFRWVDANGNTVTDRDFNISLGDRPVDGLIAAKVLDQKTINFTPETSLIGAVLNDWDNQVL